MWTHRTIWSWRWTCWGIRARTFNTKRFTSSRYSLPPATTVSVHKYSCPPNRFSWPTLKNQSLYRIFYWRIAKSYSHSSQSFTMIEEVSAQHLYPGMLPFETHLTARNCRRWAVYRWKGISHEADPRAWKLFITTDTSRCNLPLRSWNLTNIKTFPCVCLFVSGCCIWIYE